MRSSWNVGLFLFNAVIIPITGTFGPPTPWWIALIQMLALISTAAAIGIEAYAAGVEGAEEEARVSRCRAYNNGYDLGYSAGYKAANDEVRKAVDGWFNV